MTRPPTELRGVFAPVCTPFDQDEELDLAGLASNMERYAASGIHGYLALGSNGENRSLTEEERLEVLGVIVAGRRAGQVVLAGAMYDAQRDTERFLTRAAAIGADIGLVMPPSYFRKQMTDPVLRTYFSTLADSSSIPIALYNAPGFGGVTLSPALVAALSEHPNIVALKDSAESGIETFLEHCRPGFEVLAGSTNFLFEALLAGAPGGTVSLANSFPGLALDLWRAGIARDLVVGPGLRDKVSRVNRAISGSFGVAGVKAAMTMAGFVGGRPRRPLAPLAPAQVNALRETLALEGLLT